VLSMDQNQPSLETLQDIKRMMERSSRFISLSGLSGVCAGVCALAGAWIAHGWIGSDTGHFFRTYQNGLEDFFSLKARLIWLALAVLLAALISSFYFTWRKASRSKLPVWDHASRKLMWNMIIPLAAGGLFVLGLLYHNEWKFVAPACLIFYGLALVNASKYTLTDIRYLGFLEIILGSLNMFVTDYSLIFWAIGFGFLHIIYGFIMWSKYDKS
jgi:hypothetical protein